MGLTNWEITTSTIPSGSTLTVKETVGSIRGFGSLYYNGDAVSSTYSTIGYYGATARLSSTYTRGLTKGRIRFLQRQDLATTNQYQGIVLFMSTANVTDTSGSCYILGGDTLQWALLKTTTGMRNLAIIASSVTGPLPTTATPYAMEIHWASDATQYGGTSIALFAGTTLNFTDLTLRLNYTDTSSPLSTSVGEGPAWIYRVGTTSPFSANLGRNVQDNHNIYQWQ